MSEIKVNVVGQNCPVPLIETRKAINKAEKGDIIIVQGDHSASKHEIPMAMEALKLEVLEINEHKDQWEIKILR